MFSKPWLGKHGMLIITVSGSIKNVRHHDLCQRLLKGTNSESSADV